MQPDTEKLSLMQRVYRRCTKHESRCLLRTGNGTSRKNRCISGAICRPRADCAEWEG